MTSRPHGVWLCFALLATLPVRGQEPLVPVPFPAEAPAPAAPSGPIRRFALVAGNDDGGEGTRALLYARDDAKKLYEILTRVGGVHESDAMLMLNSTADELLIALGELERRSKDARARGDRTSLFFYYSGHAKDGALRLGNSSLPMESVKARLAQAPADVRVAVFDACRSGALTRAKGVRRAPAFEVESDATRPAPSIRRSASISRATATWCSPTSPTAKRGSSSPRARPAAPTSSSAPTASSSPSWRNSRASSG